MPGAVPRPSAGPVPGVTPAHFLAAGGHRGSNAAVAAAASAVAGGTPIGGGNRMDVELDAGFREVEAQGVPGVGQSMSPLT